MELPFMLGLLAVLLLAGLVWFDEVWSFFYAVFNAPSDTLEGLHWRRDLVLHASFYGTAVAAYFGFKHESILSYLIGGSWAFMCLWYSRRVVAFITEKEDFDARLRHKKMAGLFRSIARSEIERGKVKGNTDETS